MAEARFEFDRDKLRQSIEAVNKMIEGGIESFARQMTSKAKDESPYKYGNNRRSITMDMYKDGTCVKSIVEKPLKSWANQYGKVKIKQTKIPQSYQANATGGQAPPAQGIGFRVYTQSGYGGWLELGTKRMAGRPHISKAFDLTAAKFKASLERAV